MLRVFEPNITVSDKESVASAMNDGWISSSGPFIQNFESAAAEKFGVQHAVAMNSGTSALEAAVHALDLEPGSEVIVPAFTIVSCVNAILANGLTPVFVDIDKTSWNVDVLLVEEAISPKTRAIMCVHMYGMTCNVEVLEDISIRYGLRLIEDASQVHGACVGARPCGSFGDVSVFSFYANKIVTMGEGGIVCTNNAAIAQASRDYRNLYFDKERRFVHSRLGKNFRLTSLQAALGTSQLARVQETIVEKVTLGKVYLEEFKNLPIRKSLYKPIGGDCVYWMNAFEFHFPEGKDVGMLHKALEDRGFETRYFFSSLDRQAFVEGVGRVHGSLAESYSAENNGIYFPSSHLVTPEHVSEMRAVLEDFFR